MRKKITRHNLKNINTTASKLLLQEYFIYSWIIYLYEVFRKLIIWYMLKKYLINIKLNLRPINPVTKLDRVKRVKSYCRETIYPTSKVI